jgi:acyl carrier protein phosphodiesterase
MNFLAHIYLSGSDEQLMTGNFMGDFFKASTWRTLPLGYANGVLLHRLIDSFTDEHPVSADLRSVLHPVCGKYAGIALDMIYDHLLALHWDEFSSLPIEAFAQHAYKVLDEHSKVMPANCKHMLRFFSQEDWISSYQTSDGIAFALQRMERRYGGNIGFEGVMPAFQHAFDRFDAGFHRIFPELQRKCSEKIISFAIQGKDVID